LHRLAFVIVRNLAAEFFHSLLDLVGRNHLPESLHAMPF
jgi:hypothetical protein